MTRSNDPLDVRFVRQQAALSATIGNEIVVFDTVTNRYHGMNEVATAIWEMLAEPISARAIVQRLLDVYAVDREACARSVQDFLRDLERDGLVAVVRET